MALFKSSPEKSLQRDIDSAKANRDRLTAKLAECNASADHQAVVAKEAALNGDDGGLDAAEAALRAAQDRSATLKTALVELEARLADLERAKAEAADKKVRAETAAEIDRLATKLTTVGTEFNEVSLRLSEHTAAAAPLVFEALGLDRFMATCRVEVPTALDLVSTLLRAHAEEVVAGRAPASLPRREGDIASPGPVQTASESPFKYQPIKTGPTYKGYTGPKS